MAKKKTGLSQTLFGGIDPYGEPEAPTPAGQPATLPIDAIRPDPEQPRQMLPAALNQAVASGQLTPTETLRRWLEQVKEAEGGETIARRNILELRRLATSIEQHGLINPITVRRPRPDESLPAGADYFVVTGERRYWSHVLLSLEGRQIREGNEVAAPEQIKVLVASEGVSIRAHQLIENLMREDINAVERARGLWALRYELSGVNRGSPPAGETEGEERVNHGSPSPGSSTGQSLVPWSKVEETLDISKRYRIFITSVLNLCDDAQNLVIAYDFSERLIRPIVQKLKGHPDLQVEALRELVSWREDEDADPPGPIVSSLQTLVDQILARETGQPTDLDRAESKGKAAAAAPSPGAQQFRHKVQGALRFLNRLDEPDLAGLITDLTTTTEYDEVVDDLRDLRERIDTILEAITIRADRQETAG